MRFYFRPQENLELALSLGLFLITFFAGYILWKLLIRGLARWAKNTKTPIDDLILASTRMPFFIGVLILAIYVALGSSSPSLYRLNPKINTFLFVLAVASITFALANFLGQWIKAYSGRFEAFLPVASLTQNIVRALIFIVGALMILNSMGIPIAPLLATLGVGSLAVALGLQDTLANFFAGFYIILARQIRIGDYIKLDSGEEGYVTDITWRTTQIRMLPNNIVLVPNEKLTKAIVTNYWLQNKEMAIMVNLGVHYKSDLKKVEQVTCAVAREVMQEIAGGVPHFEPFLRYHTFSDSRIDCTIVLRVREFYDQYLIKHELIKRLHERYAKEGIVIPYPMRAIHYEQEQEKG